ncbi:MAG TPA: DUF1161 domain-containing protein [Terriglobales bacterium]|nr:DUF1161 domain-containing protein [Terriglobales bacterium]
MLKRCLVLSVLMLSVSILAQASKPCEELKSEIAKKLEANGVSSYSLEVVAKDQDAEGKVVGSCEGGTKKIVYRRNDDEPQKPVPAAQKQQ